MSIQSAHTESIANEQSVSFETYLNVESKAQMGELSDKIIACINSGFGQEMPEEEINDAFVCSHMFLAREPDGTVVGFGTMQSNTVSRYNHPNLAGCDPKTPIYTFESATVNADKQGTGIYKELTRHRVAAVLADGVNLLCTFTQNPKVERSISSVIEEHVQAGTLTGYEIHRNKLAGFYRRRLTASPLDTSGTIFDELDIDAGDGFHIIYKLYY